MSHKQQFSDKVTMTLYNSVNSNPDLSKTEERPIKGYPGCNWYLQYKKDANFYGIVTFHVLKGPISGKLKFTCYNDVKDVTIDFTTANKYSLKMYNSGAGSFNVTCDAQFSFESPAVEGWFVHPFELMTLSVSSTWSSELVVGDESVKVHRGFLSSISPVFEAMFSSDTKEAKTGIVEIKEMEFATVKNSIDYCLGRDMKDKTLEELIGVHQFLDKYGIVTAIDRILKCLDFKTTVDNFSLLVEYAYANSHENLKKQCVQFYYENLETLMLHPSIMKLDHDLRAALTDAAFALKESLADP